MYRKIKATLVFLILLAAIVSLVAFHDEISDFIIDNYIYTRNVDEITYNEYAKKEDYNYLQTNPSFKTASKKDLINNIYTIVDSGIEEFSFYCDENYTECENDVNNLSTDSSTLTTINNFVHPFNSYNKLYISSNNMGKITIFVDKLYTESEIKFTVETIKNIISQVMTKDMSDHDKIKSFHDYIINNTKYDQERSNEIKNNIYGNNKYNSHKASGVLLNHIALCSGYTDTMAIYLNMLGIRNFKVATNEHIWNAIYLDNNYYHLDLTWDDPVTNTEDPVLIYDFFLITDSQLTVKETQQHLYNREMYSEIATNY